MISLFFGCINLFRPSVGFGQILPGNRLLQLESKRILTFWDFAGGTDFMLNTQQGDLHPHRQLAAHGNQRFVNA
jgi:hypothetical protein